MTSFIKWGVLTETRTSFNKKKHFRSKPEIFTGAPALLADAHIARLSVQVCLDSL